MHHVEILPMLGRLSGTTRQKIIDESHYDMARKLETREEKAVHKQFGKFDEQFLWKQDYLRLDSWDS